MDFQQNKPANHFKSVYWPRDEGLQLETGSTVVWVFFLCHGLVRCLSLSLFFDVIVVVVVVSGERRNGRGRVEEDDEAGGGGHQAAVGGVRASRRRRPAALELRLQGVEQRPAVAVAAGDVAHVGQCRFVVAATVAADVLAPLAQPKLHPPVRPVQRLKA